MARYPVGCHEADIRIELLADLRNLFASSAVDFLESEYIVKELVELEGRPWAEFKGGKPLTKNQLARLLKAFEIKPEKKAQRFANAARKALGYIRLFLTAQLNFDAAT
jgi:hypothetical protein